jgi:hypothetical protein
MSLDDLQAQLRGTLDQQFAALNKKYADGIAEARRQAAADAERELVVRLDAARTEWESQVPAIVAAARVEAEAQASETLERQREEHAQALDRAVSQALAAARRTAVLELESERRRAQKEIEAAGQKATSEAAEREQLKNDLFN